jgi:hypothetical protein
LKKGEENTGVGKMGFDNTRQRRESKKCLKAIDGKLY